jgi:hypothetical protein
MRSRPAQGGVEIVGARGFWAYSPYYKCMVFVPYEGSGLEPDLPGRR